MRKLSPEEKRFIEKLVELSTRTQNVYLGNIIDDELSDIDIYIDYNLDKAWFRFDRAIYDYNPNEFFILTRDFSWKFRRYIQLLADLEKENMLFLYQESPLRDNNKRFGRLIKDRDFIPYEISDDKTVKSLIAYSLKTIITNESLNHFVKNGFKTDEEVRFLQEKEGAEKNLRVAKNTLYVTLVALFLTITTSLIQIFTEHESSGKKIISVLEKIHFDVHSSQAVEDAVN